ncbi:MAG: tetratricopeptide repeat protein [Alphaproteobacteria bacterium]|nr:tetratricopeptide repeat protein [Alphaproteobacteria bacterium]
MKLSGVKRMEDRQVLQAAFVLFLIACAPSRALAQQAPSAAMEVPDMPGAAAQAAPAQKAAEMPDMPASQGTVVPAQPQAAVATPAASASARQQPAATPAVQPSIADVAAAIAPVAAAQGASSKASPAEMAIVNNAAALKKSATHAAPSAVSGLRATRLKNRKAADKGLRVTDILATPAQVRPLPTQYLVVRKNHGANDYESRLAAARLALSEGHYAAALGLFNDLFSADTDDLRVLMGRAVALQKLGQNAAAMDTYRRVLQIDPDNVEAMTNTLGLINGKDTPEAIDVLQKLRRLYPANVAVTAQLGMLYGVGGDYGNALKYLNMADALKPGDGVILYNRAVAYDHLGKTDEAAALYHRILDLASEGQLGASLPLDDIRQRLATLR